MAMQHNFLGYRPPSRKVRTTIYVEEPTLEWARNNLRNLSVFVDWAIKQERDRRTMVDVPYNCKCGASFSAAVLEKTGAKCPECGFQVSGSTSDEQPKRLLT